MYASYASCHVDTPSNYGNINCKPGQNLCILIVKYKFNPRILASECFDVTGTQPFLLISSLNKEKIALLSVRTTVSWSHTAVSPPG